MAHDNDGGPLPGMHGFTIYESPADAPGHYVLRSWCVDEAGVVLPYIAMALPISARALDDMRRSMRESGLTCFPAEPDDDPIIIETWM